MPRHRHEPAAIRRLLERRQADKLTFQQLSERSGVPLHVLTYRAWQDARTGRREAAEPAAFVEVVATPASPVANNCTSSSGIALQVPGGLRVDLERHFDEAALARLLAIVSC